MPVTLAGLCQALPAHLHPVTPVPVPATPVAGVHVSELLDPTPFLDGGELLLTTGLTLPDQALPLDAYTARLAAHGVAGLALGLGPVFPTVPRDLPAACDRAGLPLLVVPAHTPFQAVVREFWHEVGSGRETDLQAAVGSAHGLVRAALADDPGAGVVRALAQAVDGWAALLDPGSEARHVRPRPAVPRARQAAREIARMRLSAPRSAATFSLAGDDVLVHGLGFGGRPGGYLVVGCPHPLPAHVRHLLVTACALLDLHDRWASPAAALPASAPLVLAHLARLEHPHAAADLAARLGYALPRTVRVALVRDLPPAALDRLERDVLRAPGTAPEEPTLLVLDATTAATTWADLARAAGADGGPGTGAAASAPEAAGVLTGEGAWEEIPRLIVRAREALARTPAGVWRDLVARSALADLHGLGAGDLDAGLALVDESRLDALAAYPRTDLVATLVAYLRHRGRIDPAAAELGLHRNSLRHRMTLVRGVLDADVDDPDVAAAWWLTLRARSLA